MKLEEKSCKALREATDGNLAFGSMALLENLIDARSEWGKAFRKTMNRFLVRMDAGMVIRTRDRRVLFLRQHWFTICVIYDDSGEVFAGTTLRSMDDKDDPLFGCYIAFRNALKDWEAGL